MAEPNRKEQIELLLYEARKITSYEESWMAWQRLITELEFMTEPEAKMPRFNRLIQAVWISATNEQS